MSKPFRRAAALWPSRLRPSSWPVRWRLAGVSAGLTLVILLVFGAVIGQVATSRIRDDFNREVSVRRPVRWRVKSASSSTPLGTYFRWGPGSMILCVPTTPRPVFFDVERQRDRGKQRCRALGAPGGPHRPTTRCASPRPGSAATGATTGYVQSGRSVAHVDSTVDRLWLFIARRHPRRHPARQPGRRGDRGAGNAADLGADRDRAGRSPPPVIPRAACPTPKPTTRSASWRTRSSRCCARSTRPEPSARRR